MQWVNKTSIAYGTEKVPTMEAVYNELALPIEPVNIFGIRDEIKPEEDTFNDAIGIWGPEIGIYIAQATTDPGVYYSKNKLNPAGAAHLVNGFHPQIWMIGKHGSGKWRHIAMRQEGNKVWTWRDYNGNMRREENEKVTQGWYGINMHNGGSSRLIHRYSAGCQVVRMVSDHKQIMKYAMDARKEYGQQKFSYLLTCTEHSETLKDAGLRGTLDFLVSHLF